MDRKLVVKYNEKKYIRGVYTNDKSWNLRG